jgi:prolipoprotein diacylglyceryl transferase
MRVVLALLASIPSPSSGNLHIGGPITLHMYGVMLLLGIAACIWLTARRWVAVGGDADLVYRTAVYGVIAGIIGARLYHDITSWNEVPNPKWQGIFEVWKGGLGVWGGILAGVLVGAWVVHRSGNSVRLMMDAVAPGLLLAQGIGRWGNWWNQELYGKTTDLPWALEIEVDGVTTLHHPTFLYEFIWDLLGVVALLWIDRRYRLRPPALFALYVMIYTAFRMFEETLRVDPSHHIFGMRLNFWVSLFCFIGSTAFFVWWQFLRTPEGKEPRRPPRRPRAVPAGPAMAVPKGRGRR